MTFEMFDRFSAEEIHFCAKSIRQVIGMY